MLCSRKVGEAVTKQERDDGYASIYAYSGWFKETFFPEDGSNFLMVLPIEGMVPRYRDEIPT